MEKLNIITFKLMAIIFVSVLFSCSPDIKKDKEQNFNVNNDSNHTTEKNNDAKDELERRLKIKELLKKELGDKYDAPIAKASLKQIQKGAGVYKLKCAKCHGDKGKGDGSYGVGLRIAPADLTDTGLASFYSDEGRKQIIRKGIVGTAMVAWDEILTKKEIDAVYVYIKQFVAKKTDDKNEK